MKVESALEMLLPTVQYGNLKLFTKISLDTVSDLGRVEEVQKKMDIKGDKNSTEVVAEVARAMCIDELVKLKKSVDKLTADTFQLDKAK